MTDHDHHWTLDAESMGDDVWAYMDTVEGVDMVTLRCSCGEVLDYPADIDLSGFDWGPAPADRPFNPQQPVVWAGNLR